MRTGKRAAARLCALCLCAVLLLAACREEPASRGDSDGWDSLQLIPGQYAYGEKAQTVTVWALSEKDAETIRVMDAGDYSAGSRDYEIKLQCAISYSDIDPYGSLPAAKAQDMLRLLITELLAGKGPDVLILDSCNARDLAASGALMDLSAVAREAGVYENLTQSLMVGDALPYIPYLARAPLLWGEPALVQSIESFAHLAESQAAGPPLPSPWPGPVIMPDEEGGSHYSLMYDEDPLLLKPQPLPQEQRTLIDFSVADIFVRYDFSDFARAVHGPWLVQDNGLNTQALREYFAAIKQMREATGREPSEGMPVTHLQFAHEVLFMPDTATGLYLGYARLAAAVTGEEKSHWVPAITALAKNQPVAVRPFPAKGAVWQPYTLMAVNQNSPNKEAALRFIRQMLSDDYQLRDTIGDLPVTPSAVKLLTEQTFAEYLRKAYDAAANYGTYEDVYGKNDERIQWLKEAEGFPYDLDALLRSFDTVYLPDTVVEEVVSDNMTRYLSGEATLDEAVARCEEDLSLYFAERAR